jgi:shikimate dehydrogenase
MKAAVLGRPISHSLSPVLHNAAYAALGLPWNYSAIDCGEEELADFIGGCDAEWAGFSLTMPLKRVALQVATAVDERASQVGAANTLLPIEGGWRATNTDVDGVTGALVEHGVTVGEVGSAVVLGAGGTAQAAVVALAELGLTECTVLVRDPVRAQQLRVTAQRTGVDVTVAVLDPQAEALRSAVVISTLPAGAADSLADHPWEQGQTLLDVVYSPWPTAVAAAALAGGATVVSGALMLLHQAAVQVELMTGQLAPLEAMRDALRTAAPGAGL